MPPRIELATIAPILITSIRGTPSAEPFDTDEPAPATRDSALGAAQPSGAGRRADRGAHDRRDGEHLDPRTTARAPIGYHVTLRLADDRPIATTPAAARVLARVLVHQGETRGLLAFGAADNHIHAELATDRATAGAFAHYVETSLRWRLDLAAPFEPARVRPLVDQSHAYNTFFYVQRQAARHELGHDSAREATSLPELLGLRAGATSIAMRVRTFLPRVRRAALVAMLPADPFANEGQDPALDVLAESACAAFALDDLQGRAPDACMARRAAVHAAGRTRPSGEIAAALRIGARAVRALREELVEERAVRAVVLQSRLRVALAAPPRDLAP